MDEVEQNEDEAIDENMIVVSASASARLLRTATNSARTAHAGRSPTRQKTT
jgi:hypothetical protein